MTLSAGTSVAVGAVVALFGTVNRELAALLMGFVVVERRSWVFSVIIFLEFSVVEELLEVFFFFVSVDLKGFFLLE